MNIEGNRVHSPDFGPALSPQEKLVTKIMAVALTALAALGGVIAAAVVLSMPLLGLIAAPIVIGAIALIVILGKKSKVKPAPQELPQVQNAPAAPPQHKKQPDPIWNFPPNLIQPLYSLNPPFVPPQTPTPARNFQTAPTPMQPQPPAQTHESLLNNFQQCITHLNALALYLASIGIPTEVDGGSLAHLRVAVAELQDPLTKPIHQGRLVKWMDAVQECKAINLKLCPSLLKAKISPELLHKGMELKIKASHELSQICAFLSDQFFQIGDLKNAYVMADQVTDRNTKDHLLAKIAEAYLQAGDKENAFKTIDWVIGDRKMKDAFLLKLAEAYLQDHDKINAFKMIDWVIGDRTIKDAFLLQLAEAYLEEDDKVNAFKMIDSVIGDRTMKDTFLLKLAEAYLEEGDKVNAFKMIDWVIGDRKMKDAFLLQLAEAYLEEGDKINAFKMIDWVIGDRKMKDTFLLKLAEAYLEEGNKKMALEISSWILGNIKSRQDFIKRINGMNV